jgi:hypothetical protein
MRMLLTVTVPTIQGNAALKDGSFQATMGALMNERKPEAAYFTTSAEGERTAYLVIDMTDSSAMPAFTALHARVTMQPVMNFADLTAGLKA